MNDKLRNLINDAQNILITSHISPDPDSVSSLVLMGSTLKLNYPKKTVSMTLEEEPIGLDFLNGFENIEFQPFLKSLQSHNPDLLILLDGNSYSRFSRHDAEAVRAYAEENKVKVVIIDHHEPAGQDQSDIYINRMSPATAQDVYEILFDHLALSKPPEAAQTAMVGFYADTGGFVYLKDGTEQGVFRFAEALVKQGADVEAIKNQLSQYSEDDMRAIGELAANVKHQDDYTYSFITDEFVNDWLKNGHTQAELQKATGVFLDDYIRNIGGRKWGFIVYKNTLQGQDFYSASFRAANQIKDVSVIAGKLGGGGHKPAAGAKFEATSVEDALTKVRSAIASS
jgi:phosphoesterase RecJ-like protein